MKLKLCITNLQIGEFKLDEFNIEQEMNQEELLAYASLVVDVVQNGLRTLHEAPSAEPDAPDDLYHVSAGKYDGEERNCKYCNSFHSEFEAKAIYDKLRDYPWAEVEHNGAVLYAHGAMR